MKFLDSLLDLIFPPRCPFCGRVLERTGVCRDCREHLPWTAGDDRLRRGADGLVCCAPLWYRDRAREGILHLKFQGRSGAAEPMGRLLADCAAACFPGGFDVLTWVPVSPRRLRQRGFDQAELLARAAGKRLGFPVERLLRKTVDNPAQSGIAGAAARRANVLGVYETARGAAVQGRRILLVDDVCTTGSTLSACLRVLQAAGAASVVCAAVALTPQEGHGKTREENG